MGREILHLRLPSFPLQVICGDKRKFLDYPMVLCGGDFPCARVLVVNPKARLEGIRGGMLLSQARRLCKRVEVYVPKPGLFSHSQKVLLEFLGDYSPLVEPSKNGFYLDLTGTHRLLGPAIDVGDRLIRELDSRFSLVSASGIASNKLVSRSVVGVIRAPGLAQVLEGEEANFLKPFPLKKLISDYELVARLSELGFERAEDIQKLSLFELESAFGKDGYQLYLVSRGLDFSPVIPPQTPPEIEEGESLVSATNDIECLRLILFRLCSRLGKDLRRMRKSAGLLRLVLVYRDGRRCERRIRFKPPTSLNDRLYQASCHLLESAYTRRVQVVYLGIRASGLVAGYQLDLFGEYSRKERLYLALDYLQERYGERSVIFGRELCSA